LTGFIANEANTYKIDVQNSQILVGAKNIKYENGVVEISNSVYVESNLLTEAFGLNILFNFRSLSVKMDATFEFPKIKQARLENMRSNIIKLQTNTGSFKDTVVGREYHFFKAGTLNWSANSFQTSPGTSSNNFGLGLGSELLHGEANVSIFLNSQSAFDNRQLFYNWRWIDNQKKYIKQAQVGKLSSQSISFLKAPLVGASINNSSNTLRKARGTYIISEYTEPNWTVELYINDALVNYTTADASGLYLFKVPIVYGYTTLRLKFYGPLGEERTDERIMNTPYTFMPVNVLEYNITAGILEDERSSQFGRAEVNYGLTRFMTIGGGVEYLSSVPEHPTIPFANVSFQPFSKMVINMEYAQNVVFKGLLNYYIGKSSFLELDYRKYAEGQLATFNTANEERRIKFSFPYKLYSIMTNTKLSFNQFVYNTFNYNQINSVFSGNYKNYSANFSLASNWINNSDLFLTSNLALSYKLISGLILRSSVDYNFSSNKLLRYGAILEKRVAKVSFSATIERNVQINANNFLLNFKYDLNFARMNFSAAYNNNSFNLSESAQGGLAFGGDNGYVHASNNSTLGKGGILLYPFLDLNNNGKKDEGENRIFVKDVKVINGRAMISKRDSIIRISDLNSFVNYNVQFSDADLENISWRFKHRSYEILVDPNQYKKVEVPIVVVGEVSGMVYLNTEGKLKGLGRITIQIFNDQGQKVVETLSEADGYFSYLGLKPGKFIVKVDDKQLGKLDYKSSPQLHKVEIEVSEDGTVVEELDFQITSKDAKVDSKVLNVISPETKVKFEEKTLLDTITPKSIKNILDSEELFYSIKVGVYQDHFMPKELENLDTVFYEDLADSKVQYYYGFFRSLDRAIIAKNALVLRGINGTSVVTYQFGKKITTPSVAMKKEEVLKENDIPIITVNQGNTRKNISFGKISDIKEDFFSVQIGVFRNYVPSERLRYFNPVYYEFKEDGLIRYISGQFKTFGEAKKMKYKINEKGIKDAFIVKYKNGLRSDSKKD
jgi:hypothetical protein